jgi:hypothetical protein
VGGVGWGVGLGVGSTITKLGQGICGSGGVEGRQTAGMAGAGVGRRWDVLVGLVIGGKYSDVGVGRDTFETGDDTDFAGGST